MRLKARMMGTGRSTKYPAITEAAKRWDTPTTNLLELCIAIQQIAAPIGKEGTRAAWVGKRMEALGLKEIVRDPTSNNVYGCWPGEKSYPALLVTAHTDTVFGIDT